MSAPESPTSAPTYPPVEPYASGMLAVGDGHEVWWEECGNPDGKPVVFLHGGPGGGSTPSHRRLFDPAAYRIVLLDQRGCGRSTPHVSEPDPDLSVITTWHLVADLELLREARGIERWQVFGGSWGSTLALAYAQRHPDRVTELVLRGIWTIREVETVWLLNGGAGAIFPAEYDALLAGLGPDASEDVVGAYGVLLADPDPAVHMPAARAWVAWENALVSLLPRPELNDVELAAAVAMARLECWFISHGGWLDEGELIANAASLAGIPTLIVQGRYDVCTPPMTAWDLHRALPGSELQLVEGAGHLYDEPGVLEALVAATDRFAG